jgi:mono/diheme cytochrome c family protein
MSKTARILVALAGVVLWAGSVSFAQSSGEATYKAKCLNCHGATGMADTTVGKALKIKPITDPGVKSFTEAQMVAATNSGTGKMQPFKDKLTDAEIKAAVDYFRTFIK